MVDNHVDAGGVVAVPAAVTGTLARSSRLQAGLAEDPAVDRLRVGGDRQHVPGRLGRDDGALDHLVLGPPRIEADLGAPQGPHQDNTGFGAA